MSMTSWNESQEHTKRHYGEFDVDWARVDLIRKLCKFDMEVSIIDQPMNTVLEVGAYHGVTRGFNKATVVGVDPLADTQPLTKGVGEQLPIMANSMDYVFSWNTLDHVKYPWLVMDEIKRVLKPSGELLLSVNVYDVPWFVHRHIVSRFGKHHPWYFRPDDVRELLDDCGFTFWDRLIEPPKHYARWLLSGDYLASLSVLLGLKILVVRGGIDD